MTNRRYTLPSTTALIAFEAVARLRGFGRAAEELNTSQSAISRHIRNLELRLGAQLIDRGTPRPTLTRRGEAYYATVSSILSELDSATRAVGHADHEVTLVCTHEVSHLIVMPRFEALSIALGPSAHLRILTTEYDLIAAAVDTGADIIFGYGPPPDGADAVTVHPERVAPAGTASMIARTRAALAGNAPAPPLLGLRKANYGWLDWSDWLNAQIPTPGWQVTRTYDNYVYLLEAAVRGEGLALGWDGFLTRYLDAGDLVTLDDSWVSKGTALTARLTRFGTSNVAAQKCLALLRSAPALS